MKTTKIFLLAMTSALCLAACGGSSNSGDTDNQGVGPDIDFSSYYLPNESITKNFNIYWYHDVVGLEEDCLNEEYLKIIWDSANQAHQYEGLILEDCETPKEIDGYDTIEITNDKIIITDDGGTVTRNPRFVKDRSTVYVDGDKVLILGPLDQYTQQIPTSEIEAKRSFRDVIVTLEKERNGHLANININAYQKGKRLVAMTGYHGCPKNIKVSLDTDYNKECVNEFYHPYYMLK